MGRPAIPNNVHRMRGNPSKKSASELRDAVRPETHLPRAPGHLLPEAKREWTRIGRNLEKLGLVSDIDRAALAVYCQAYARWRDAEIRIADLGESALVESTPSGYKQMGVWLQISNRAVDQMHKFAVEFGMTPSARSRVQPNQQLDLFDDEGKDRDPAARYFA